VVQFRPVEPPPSHRDSQNSSGVPNIDKGIGVEQHEIRSLSSFDGTETVRLSIKGRNSACGDPQGLHRRESRLTNQLLQFIVKAKLTGQSFESRLQNRS